MQGGNDSHHNDKLMVVNSPLYRQLLPAYRSMKALAQIAIHRLAATRRERDLGMGAALDAGSRIKVPAGDAAAVSAVHSAHLILCRTAWHTTFRRVGKPLAGEERLLVGAEGESVSAIDAFQFLVR